MGSTVISDIFNKNPYAEFLFEPFLIRNEGMFTNDNPYIKQQKEPDIYLPSFNLSQIEIDQMEILDDNFHCRYVDLAKRYLTEKFMTELSSVNQHYHQLYTNVCQPLNYCFPQFNRNFFVDETVFCSPTGVKQHGGRIIDSCRKRLKENLPKFYSNMCRSKRIVVSKVVRMFDLSLILKKYEQDTRVSHFPVIFLPHSLLA